MNECPLRVCEEKFKVLNHRVDDVTFKIDDVNDIKLTLAKLTLLSEQNVISNQSRDELLRVHGETLVEVTTTLKEMNKEIIASKIQSEKAISNLDEKVSEICDSNSIKISDLVKKAIYALLGIACGLFIANTVPQAAALFK